MVFQYIFIYGKWHFYFALCSYKCFFVVVMFAEPATFLIYENDIYPSTIDNKTFWCFTFGTWPKDLADHGFQNPCLDQLLDTSAHIHYDALLIKFYFLANCFTKILHPWIFFDINNQVFSTLVLMLMFNSKVPQNIIYTDQILDINF